jgi:hypothetical protein
MSDLLQDGQRLVTNFCKRNDLEVPKITVVQRTDRNARVNACAWYRSNHIWVKPWACASPTQDEGRYRWSYPGYLVDRTVYGALAHEIGHHLEPVCGLPDKPEKPISGYRDNPSEVFAEHVKLFLTNPDLLGLIRPLTYDFLRRRFTPIKTEIFWQDVLADAPLKIRTRCERLVEEAR